MFGNLGKIMKLMGDLKTKLPEMKQKLADSRYSAQAGGGAVKATVSGKLVVIAVEIDPALLAGGDVNAQQVGELVTAAVSAAQELAATAAEAAMKELTGGIDIPGMDLAGM